MELICRGLCCCCCDFAKVNRKPGAEDFLGGEEEQAKEGAEGEGDKQKDNMQEPPEFAMAKPGSAGEEPGFDEENRSLIK